MLIQCHACNTKYRLNLEQIPRRKTFVRCKHCGTPIYIDPTEESEFESHAGVIPAPAVAAPPEAPLVTCPGCRARYRVPAEMQAKPEAKLKCSQCGILFASPLSATVAAAASAQGAQAAAGAGMPLPGEERMEELFDDLRPEEGIPQQPDRFHQTPPELGALDDSDFDIDSLEPDPDQAYLEAISFGEDQDTGTSPKRGTVPDDQKYSMFLNPKEFDGDKEGGGEGAEPSAREPESDLPHPDELGATPETESPEPVAPPEPELGDLPPLPDTPPEKPKDKPEIDHLRETREEIPGQAPSVMTEKRVLMVLAAASVLILIGTAAWGFLLATRQGPEGAFAVQVGQSHQLQLDEGLQGRYLVNRPSGKRLFVVTGQVENQFPDADNVHWIRIRGMAYADRDQSRPLAQAFAYAGNILEDSQLTQWELPAIKAYYGFINGRKDMNLEIPSGSKVPYQLVFMDMTEQAERTVAEVVSYRRREQTVFIDTP